MGPAEGCDKSFGGADDNRTTDNRTADNRTINSRTGGRVLTPEEHWQRYRPQLATQYGHWRFWLPAQGREAKLSLELLREITPVEVESGAEEYVLRGPNKKPSFGPLRLSASPRLLLPLPCLLSRSLTLILSPPDLPRLSTSLLLPSSATSRAVDMAGVFSAKVAEGAWRFSSQPAADFSAKVAEGVWHFSCGAHAYRRTATLHEQFKRREGFPAKVAAGAWPFSCEDAGRLTLLSTLLLSPQHEQFNRQGDFPAKPQVQSSASPIIRKSSPPLAPIIPPRRFDLALSHRDHHPLLLEKPASLSLPFHPSPLLCLHRPFLTGPGAQLNVAFSEASLSLRQDDTVLPTGSRNNDHTAGRYQATDGSTNPSDQSRHGTWASPHWKTPLPTHLPASLPPLPPKPLYGVPHYIYTDLYATPLPEHPNKRLETQNMEVFSGYSAGIPKAQQTKYGVWALPRGVVVAMPSPLEPMLSGEGGGEGEEFWLVVTYVRGGGQGMQGGSDGVSEDRGGVELGGGEGEEGGGIEDTGYMVDGEWKVQQVMIAYDALGRFEYVKHTRFM
ncbi:unnamed protein product [Closterium sp. Naga37s-1]|nr:unnamed protein product [Closterium sp. Naga37s-1]